MTEEHQQIVARLVEAGISISQIARSIGVSRDKVRTIVQRQAALKAAADREPACGTQ